MTKSAQQKWIRRILVALDASSDSLAGLDAAIALAIKLEAEILGVYVEDINLLRLADMPFAQELGHFSAHSRKLDTGQLERQLRTQAGWAHLALKQAAEKAGLNWAFRVLRGSIPAELMAITRETDLIIIGQRGLSGFTRIGSTAQTIVAQANILTLVLREGVRLGPSVMVVYDASAGAPATLRLAGSLAQARDGKLVVLLLAAESQVADVLSRELTSWSQQTGLPLTIRWLKEVDARMICTIARTEDSGMLILPKDSPAIDREILLTILADIDCPVMFVRQPEGS